MRDKLIRWLFGPIMERLKAVEDDNLRLARKCLDQQNALDAAYVALASMASEINNLRNSRVLHSESEPVRVRKATTWREYAAAAFQQQQGARK